jgi:tRNA A-37 threonylcarbamoyl transferase component Bud32
MALSSGQLLQGNYRIVRLLGQGGMGAVYLAEHTRLHGRLLAIKENTSEPFADQATRDQLREQFYTEAKILAALDHPSLPKVTDYFIEDGVEYLVMDFVEGENLSDRLDSHLQQHGKPLPESQVLDWADQMLSALVYMHSRQPHPVVHRDIKPANIILTSEGIVHLVDFGLVKLMSNTGQSTAAAMRGMGTPDYTPLEQYPGSQTHTDARTDIYSLGATLYHLLTGSPPVNVRDRLLGAAALTPLRQLNPSVSANTEKAILRVIEIKPDDRFQTAGQMRDALAGKGMPRAAAVPGRRPRMALLTGAALAALALLIGVLLALNDRGATPSGAVVSAATPSVTSSAPVVAEPTATATLPAATATPEVVPVSDAGPLPSATATRRLPDTATPLALESSTSTAEASPSATAIAAPPTATATLRAAAVASPTTTAGRDYQVAPVLLNPANDANASAEQTFSWRWDGPPLRADERFDWRLLRNARGEDALATRSVTTAGVTVPLGGLGGGDYYWSVRVIQVGGNGELVALRSPEAGRRLLRWNPPVQNPPTDAPRATDTPAPPLTDTPRATDTPVPLPTDTPVPLPTNTLAPPTSRSLAPDIDEDDLGAVGAGGGAGLGLFMLVIGLSVRQEWRRDDR